jgi:RHS repeat-associated protein
MNMRLAPRIAVQVLIVLFSTIGAFADQYIVVLKREASLLPDEAKLGGHVDFKKNKRLVVTLPDGAVEAWRKHPSVKYMQLVVLGTGRTSRKNHLLGSAPASTFVPGNAAAPPTWNSGNYSYDGSGNIYNIGPDREGKASAFYYDLESRLLYSDIGGRKDLYSYDEFGNIKSIGDVQLDPSPVTNRLLHSTYDPAGNVTQQSGRTYRYDPIGMLQEKTWDGVDEVYLYTPSDERIGIRIGTTSAWQETTWTIRDEQGRELREYEQFDETPDAPWTWMEDHTYRGDLLVGAQAEAAEGGATHFHLDHLATPRLITNSAGIALSLHDYLPFGVELTPPCQQQHLGADHDETMHFTGHRRDIESADCTSQLSYLDYLHARNYSAKLGRFLSVDPILGDRLRPQSWNRYTYVQNNPLTLHDPSGMRLEGIPGPMGPESPGFNPACLMCDGFPDITGAFDWINGKTLSDLKEWASEHPYKVANPRDDPKQSLQNLVDASIFIPGIGEFRLLAEAGESVEVANVVVYVARRGGKVIYVGITNNLERRAAQHAGRFAIDAVPGLEGLTRLEARAFEQQLIDRYGLNNLLNKINSIARSNDVYDRALDFAASVFEALGK